ncbi:MAG: cytochrome c-type biogenesis CcmF C-terminal domain-containing protein [candidate division WOR-3 bacterium]
MIYEFAEFLLRLGILSSLIGLVFSFLSIRISKFLIVVLSLSIFLANAVLLYALISSDFSLIYVINYTSKDLPTFYKFTAWWGGQAGSLMFWLFILGVYSLWFLRHMESKYSSFLVFMTFAFFLITTTYSANPFERLPIKMPDGRGLNPLLQNIWMAVHPPLLYLGYVGTTFPAALSLESAFKGFSRIGIDRTRFWAIISWMFLTLGILLGGRWAYLELGWGGYWAWDPVENASFFPWITLTALIHTYYLTRMGSHKLWFFNLAFLSYSLSIIGTFLTRSGIVESVHAFAFSGIGHYFLAYISIILIILLVANFGLFRFRTYKNYKTFSRGWYLRVSNYVWVIILFAVLFGTFYPLITEMLVGVQMSLGKDYYTFATSPLFALILLLSVLALDSPWDKTKLSIKTLYLITSAMLSLIPIFFTKNPYLSVGLFVVVYALLHIVDIIKKTSLSLPSNLAHLGLIITSLGIVLSWNLGKKHEIPFKVNESKRFYLFELKHLGWQEYKGKNYEGVYAVLNVKMFGRELGDIMAERRLYNPSGEVTSEAGILPMPPFGDLYAVIQGAEDDGTFYYEIYFNPGIQLVWIGPLIIAFAGLMGIIRRNSSV